MDNATLKYYFKAVISSYAEVLFLQNPWYGLVLLMISFFNINIALAGLAAIITVLAFASLIRMEPAFLQSGFYIYNPLLVGMSIGFLFQVTIVSLLLIVMASVFTFLLTMVLYHLFSKASVPILSLPFTLVSTLIYLATLNYTSLYTQALYVRPEWFELPFLPLSIQMYFKSFGTILFLPHAGIGLLFALLILAYSRIMLLLSLGGFFLGVFVHGLMLGSWQLALANPYAFNYILISVALGAIFLVPSLRSIAIAMIGVAMSVILIDASSSFWTIYKIPVFTLPFNVIVISFLFVLQVVKFKEFAYDIKKTPELTLRAYILSLFRFKHGEINLFLPFSGTWSVYQAFDDEWTHQGKWRFAYDFVIEKDGRSYKDTGDYLEDYFAYKKPVLSPVSGYVVDLEEGIDDNPIGKVNTIENWGNYVVIQGRFGHFIELSHFAKGSLKVKKGDFVEAGQILGLCGNSGYSPQPHIHIQVQESALVGSSTLPFHFVSYIEDNEVHFYTNPVKNSQIESYFNDKSLDKKLSFTLDNEYVYEVMHKQKTIDTLHIKVKMDRFSGKFYFEDKDGNTLNFAKEAGMFYFYDYAGKDGSWLQKIFISIPRIPLTYKKQLTWDDYLPARDVNNSVFLSLLSLGAIFIPQGYVVRGRWMFKDEETIEGELSGRSHHKSKIKLDHTNGIESIELDEYTLRMEK